MELAFLKTASVCLIILIHAVLLNALQLLSLLVYPLLDRPEYRQIIRFTQRAYTEVLILLSYLFAPTQMLITGDQVHTKSRPESVVMIANHQAYSDWIFLWQFAQKCNAHGLVKIILKDSLRHIPIVGWGMRFFEFIFLKRNWLHDQRYMASMLDLITRHNEKVWLLLFPEGTIYCDETRKRSDAFALKCGITDTPKHVLLPRVTGLEFCLKHLRKDIDAVYDVTVGYSDITTECALVKRTDTMYMVSDPAPRLHLHIRRFPVSDIPINDDDCDDFYDIQQRLDESHESKSNPATRSSTPGGDALNTPFRQWLHQIFKEKDDLMDHFYKHGYFPGGRLLNLNTINSDKSDLIVVGDRRKGLLNALGPECALVKVWLFYTCLLMVLYAAYRLK